MRDESGMVVSDGIDDTLGAVNLRPHGEGVFFNEEERGGYNVEKRIPF